MLVAFAADAEAATRDVCVQHPSEISVVCTRGEGHIVDVCDRDQDGNKVYARVVTVNHAPGEWDVSYDDNGQDKGCGNLTYAPLVTAVAVCAQNEGCSAFASTQVPDPPAPPQPVANGQNATDPATITLAWPDTNRRLLTMRFADVPTLTGTLVNNAGTPIVGATVDISAQQRVDSATPEPIGSATTDAGGAFSLAVPAGPSRRLTVTYTASDKATGIAGSASLRTRVRARLSARAVPRVTSPGESVRLTGRLRNLPRGNVDVDIQVSDRRAKGGWRTIDDVKTDLDGAYAWRHRFLAVSSGKTFRFRALVDSPIYPFHPGRSKPVRFRVR